MWWVLLILLKDTDSKSASGGFVSNLQRRQHVNCVSKQNLMKIDERTEGGLNQTRDTNPRRVRDQDQLCLVCDPGFAASPASWRKYPGNKWDIHRHMHKKTSNPLRTSGRPVVSRVHPVSSRSIPWIFITHCIQHSRSPPAPWNLPTHAVALFATEDDNIQMTNKRVLYRNSNLRTSFNRDFDMHIIAARKRTILLSYGLYLLFFPTRTYPFLVCFLFLCCFRFFSLVCYGFRWRWVCSAVVVVVSVDVGCDLLWEEKSSTEFGCTGWFSA